MATGSNAKVLVSFLSFYLLTWSIVLGGDSLFLTLGQEERIHRQRPHPNPELYTSVRPPDPSPLCISELLRYNDPNHFMIHHLDLSKHSKFDYTLIILVESLQGELWRSVMRSGSWSLLPDNVFVLYVIPIRENNDEMSVLIQESEANKDVIIFTRVSPSDAASGRLIHYLHWVRSMFNFTYLLRTYDGYFINFRKIVQRLSSFQLGTHLYRGYFRGTQKVNNADNGLWIHCPSYTPHADEGAFILSTNLIDRFLKLKKFLNYYHNEGGSIGLWCSPYKDITLLHDVDFNSGFTSRGCLNRYVVMPTNSTTHMKELYTVYSSRDATYCPVEYEVEASYHYNWTLPPNQCCQNKV